MSAYASLPGSFLPPFFSFGGASSTATEKDGSEPKTDGVDTTVDAASMQSNSSQTKDAPASHSSSTPRSASHSSSTACSSSFVSPSAFKALSLSSNSDDCKKPQLSSAQPSDIIIAIRSARVDPVELIKSLTSKGSNIARRTANFIARTPDVVSSTTSESATTDDATGEDADSEKGGRDEVPVYSSPGLCYEDSDSDEEYSMYDYSDDFSTPNDDDDSHDDLHHEDNQSSSDEDPSAIEFELDITFQGRKYNATRAFPTFVKLRNDLLRELNVNEGDVHRRSRRSGGAKSPSNIDPEDNSKSMPMIPNQNNDGSSLKEGISVPELPRVSQESLGHGGGYALSGVARSGFALLQATAQHYCPEMEHWIGQVIHTFPCSQSLSSFLWEPLSSSNASWETIGEGDELDSGDLCQNEKNSPLLDLSEFAKKPPMHTRIKPRSNFSKNSRFKSRGGRSRGSSSSLDSIEEGYDNDCDDHST
mmetsp:Transcript_37511/g.65812  ORF Transcript_37511/g.65812 Transcript_37511/m.65812 type:complete len:476 (-) Transcript_37511:492-1919(-)|eukprot:CAMPEP_0201873054 /NCGR_PEP_ID=MMETSP0902-20130614/5642_1 /ASSEMBLY_ACC=CAM_ASM_000551 /TAXON_ID=420261 /ORGANISM="Thalassiosira antarctica, Strain CCMP982" /LENGTH=475 /DNA_ID=CAMNT_0048399541 /DNA_START=255 /DNA_END=1682 /DNA_ORIENTATION=-